MTRRATRRSAARLLLGTTATVVLAAYLHDVAGAVAFRAPGPTPYVTDRHGRFLAQFGHATGTPASPRTEYGFWRTASAPDRIVRATLALEDRRFWQHPGVDPLAVLRAVWQDVSSLRRRSGASTLAMQVARMQHPAPRTLWAKAVEAGTGLALTLRYGRQAVLAQYLRLVPYGNGSHGIAHAARFYFDRPVEDLSWAQIALLCAIPQAPTLMNPLHPSGLARAKRRGQRILARLRSQDVLTAAEHAAAQLALGDMPAPAPARRPDALHVVERLRAMLTGPGSQRSDLAEPRRSASLDLAVHTMASGLIRQHVAQWAQAGAQQAAMLIVRRDTREVVAAVGSADRTEAGGAIDFTRAALSPGSTLKPFLYAAAMQRGVLHPAEMLDDRPEGAAGIANADGTYLGRLLPRQALANSRNAPAVAVLRRLGLDDGFGLLRTLGLHDGSAPASSFGLSLAIGSLPTSLDRLVQAYGALADDGVLRDLVWLRGQSVPAPRRVFSTEAARETTLFLADPLARLPSFPRYGTTELPFPVALKTGTSQGYRDAWTVAWTDRWMVAAWVGRPDNAPMAGLTGARVATGLVRDTLVALHGTEAGALADGGFLPPPGWRSVPLCAGGDGGQCSRTLLEWIPPDQAQPGQPSAPMPSTSMPSTSMPAVASSPSVAPDTPVQLSITAPDHNSRVWRNPESPAGQDVLVLRAQVSPAVPEVLWYVDGAPFKLAGPNEPVAWPMRPGAHRFQVRLPLRPDQSRPVRIVVE